ncbi:sigma factor-like helix-turn-helix DNA-binding protein [Halalkalibacterium halodurans]|uniref:sigma factor-like helix-turn-helix DNA-binding protein n=1 Tax=Halalkalibacterium halodurans TaxID=86665 RepID=UPI002E1BC663|nr:sigma factor-like helix-turn-helix DNA-binding protein [Halalkalibacterium halodurans]MED4124138.1 sigma factor-like helix-turn-helix DNA-binding protein [Halalkalibacterium halodurans]
MYEWLRDYQQLIQNIEYLEFKLEREESELKRWVHGDLADVKLHPEAIAAKLEERIDWLKKEIKYKKNQLDKLISLVDTFKGLDQRILKLKYVDGMTLDEIADYLNYSTSHIKKRHAELVRLIKFVDEQGII